MSIAPTEYGAILLDKKTGTYWNLTETGLQLITMLRQGMSVSEVAIALGQEYEAPVELIEQDLLALLKELEKAGLTHEL
ncbi:PqqD family protein [Leucobacter insecticola]|uniref:PqqD family protein n=1 Tax=Leucobacter insecticola TaxID=2714934 RepID=A0A6G8FIA0_9MICO|nr:PqqD family peptide modification chaperone [Leucobacter insecticola]QIM16023.1 PqqD family protein [Leucobacter insecticola]